MQTFAKRMDFTQTFSVAYSLWYNGTVEVVNSKVLASLQTFVNECGTQGLEWDDYMPLVQLQLNNAPRRRKGGMSAHQIFNTSGYTEKLVGAAPRHRRRGRQPPPEAIVKAAYEQKSRLG